MTTTASFTASATRSEMQSPRKGRDGGSGSVFARAAAHFFGRGRGGRRHRGRPAKGASLRRVSWAGGQFDQSRHAVPRWAAGAVYFHGAIPVSRGQSQGSANDAVGRE